MDTIKWLSLATLTIQNVITVTLLRYVRSVSGDTFLITTAIFFQEIIKLMMSSILFYLEILDFKKFQKFQM